MRTFKRIHHTGTVAVVIEHSDGWRTTINLREPDHNPTTTTGYFALTIEQAQTVADREIAKYGHVCNEACKDWVELQQIVPFSP